jgi:hypothetical protein
LTGRSGGGGHGVRVGGVRTPSAMGVPSWSSPLGVGVVSTRESMVGDDWSKSMASEGLVRDDRVQGEEGEDNQGVLVGVP